MIELSGIAIIGSGGIGGYLAGALARGGHRPTLCVRTAFDRLEVTEGGETRAVEVPVAADPAAVGPVRWVLLTTKAQDIPGAAPWLATLAGPGTTVAVIQNGVDHARRAAPYLPPGAALLPTIIYCAVERTAPGRIVHHGGARMHVPADEQGGAFAEIFAGSGFEIVREADFVTTAWRKLLSNAVANAITALTLRRMTVFTEAAVQALARDLMTEVIAVARAEGARIAAEDGERILASYARMGRGGSSMLYDRLAGRPLEHDFISGAVVEAAGRHGIDVPLNRAVLALLVGASGHPLDGSA
ncbi:2-dehydropantoate 2-reductase [Methylobacterium isbiliense]|jgi:2-dehydropantoate 2-reductase|uniref:2-dehydropantoate 2-reductase n=1 Tax=Methylobacterium isbiliense TaxID=315478 RepID=A0ABQ4SL87_9HYPH|nr:2-dehydropantoate 2-reductase [Methylobacterium isbiliense]MDN3622146.1 2-dehydropantoate 2-reductase [Methylobacterium isbiliense]GJE03289.1 2-dehydropantoate 2-reductase [Methylobacterium isbiliense]